MTRGGGVDGDGEGLGFGNAVFRVYLEETTVSEKESAECPRGSNSRLTRVPHFHLVFQIFFFYDEAQNVYRSEQKKLCYYSKTNFHLKL
jgi:hypothetical protein